MANFTTAGSSVYKAGCVLQTIMDTHASEAHTTSGTFNAPFSSNLQVTITPASSSNKILVSTSWEWEFQHDAGQGHVEFYRDISGGATSLSICGSSDTGEGVGRFHSSEASDRGVVHYAFLDSPNTTSAINYRPSLRAGGTGNFYIGSGGNGLSMIIVQEIQG